MQFQKAGLIAEMRRHDERLAIKMERRHAVKCRARHALRLPLIIKQRDSLTPESGCAVFKSVAITVTSYRSRLAIRPMSESSDVARHRDVVFVEINVIRPVAGVIAVIAIVVIIVIVIIPIVMLVCRNFPIVAEFRQRGLRRFGRVRALIRGRMRAAGTTAKSRTSRRENSA